MKILTILLFVGLAMAASTGLTVEEAWKNYLNNPLPKDTPTWIEKVKSFEEFKQRWDKAREFNDKYATTEDAWVGYKKLFKLSYAPEEDARRLEYFRGRWETTVAHNERYARGEVYYPMWNDAFWQLSPEETLKLRDLPQYDE